MAKPSGGGQNRELGNIYPKDSKFLSQAGLTHYQHLTTLLFWRLLACMNPHILIVLTKPKPTAPKEQLDGWKNFESNVNNSALWPQSDTEKNNGPEKRLAENVWLIPLQDGMPFLGKLVAAANSFSVPCKMMLFEDSPPWIVSEPE
ncbi:MAG: hypothetical protein ABSE16_09695 [Verrucomicrobiota bacterium]|jgi:hypothetical protein